MNDKSKSEPSADNKAPKADPSLQAKDNVNLRKSLLKERNRQYSEPSSAFGQPEPGSQKSVKDGRQRQDSTSSAGFGSSHFGSSANQRDADGSALRINVVTEPASLVPTLSTEHVANLDELDPQNNNNDDGVEMLDVAGSKSRLQEIPETNGTTGQTSNGIAASKEKSPVQSAVADLDKMSPKELEAFKKKECRKYMKNLLVLCTGFFFVFTAFLSLRNLQSSLNAKGGLGLYALSSTYACFFIGCIMATTIVQRLGPKRAIVVSTIGPFLYVLANFYPLFYTLIPAAASAGFCQGVIWTAHATYIANIAASYAELTKDKLADVLSRFNGIFFVFYQSCQIIGGMISSIILKSPEESLDGYYVNGSWSNFTAGNGTTFGNESAVYFVPANATTDYSHCGIGYCPTSSGVKGAAPVDRYLVYILVGIFTACCLTGILVLAFLLDRLEGQMKKPQKTVGKQLVAVFKFYYNRYAICMVGLMFYSLLQAAFMFGEYNKAFVTCTIGIHNVGFIMMTLSSSSAIAAFVNGRIQKWTTRPPLLTIGFLFQFGVFMTLLSWKPTPADTPVFFILVIFWGIGDGIIMTQDISIIGLLFSHNKEPAFAALKMTQSIANFTFFMAAPYLCTVQKIAFVLTVLLIAATGYYVLELIQLCERRRAKKAKMAEQEKLTDCKEPVKI